MKYTCHSGGCPGSDMAWETEGYKYNIETIAYSFYNHVQESKNPKILTLDELNEGFEHVKIASTTLKRNIYHLYPYVKNLLSRNWFQVKNSDAIFAIGKFLNSANKLVSGGTGWAVQMAIDSGKDVYFFDQPSKSWYKYNPSVDKFELIDYILVITENFAGIGTREINEDGLTAIREILKHTFEK